MTLEEDDFRKVLMDVVDQVFDGKGNQRHGFNTKFSEQPWAFITKNVGTGFVIGQAIKKLMELRALKEFPAWKREALGAIAYIVMAIMWNGNIDNKKQNE